MPSYIDEITIRGRKFFLQTDEDDNGEMISQRQINLSIMTCRSNDFLYIMLYDNEMNLLEDACRYLNFEIRDYSETTRRTHATVLRLFHVFLEFTGCEIESLSTLSVTRMISFFCGDNLRNDLSAGKRSRETVNNYLSIIRLYIRYCSERCTALESSKEVIIPAGSNASGLKLQRFNSSLRTNPHANDYACPYISPSEYLRLKDIAARHGDMQAVMLFHLMFIYGLRIGECLGITEEDLTLIEGHDGLIPTLLIRNRLSDKPFQFAKGLGHIRSTNEYKAKNYSQVRITLTSDFFRAFMSYIEDSRGERIAKETYDRSAADIVSCDYPREHNHYVFTNVFGKPLSQQAWNLRLKCYFQEAGIPIDMGKKRDNLSHRFRHGCAMYYLRFAEHKLTLEEVSRLLRHRSILTTTIYEKMTYEDELREKEEFQDKLFTSIPEIRQDHEN